MLLFCRDVSIWGYVNTDKELHYLKENAIYYYKNKVKTNKWSPISRTEDRGKSWHILILEGLLDSTSLLVV